MMMEGPFPSTFNLFTLAVWFRVLYKMHFDVVVDLSIYINSFITLIIKIHGIIIIKVMTIIIINYN